MCAFAQLRDNWIVNNVHECFSKIVNSASVETEVMNEYTCMSVGLTGEGQHVTEVCFFSSNCTKSLWNREDDWWRNQQIVCVRHLELVERNVAFQMLVANTKWDTPQLDAGHFEPTLRIPVVGTHCRRFVYQEVRDNERRCHHVTTKFIVGDTKSVSCVHVSSICTKDQKRRSVFLIHLTH